MILKRLKRNHFAIISIIMVFAILIGSVGILLQNQNQKQSQAASNTLDVILGQVDTGTNLDVSICIRSQGDTMTITNVSNWIQFDNSQLTPNPTIIETGNFVITDGYAPMKFEQVLPAPQPGQTDEKWSLRLDFIDGFAGRAVETAYPELFGKVTFAKSNQNITPAVVLDKTQYFFNESPDQNEPALINIINSTFDCRDTDGDTVNDDTDTAPLDPCIPNNTASGCQQQSSSSSQESSSVQESSVESSTSSLSSVESSSSVESIQSESSQESSIQSQEQSSSSDQVQSSIESQVSSSSQETVSQSSESSSSFLSSISQSSSSLSQSSVEESLSLSSQDSSESNSVSSVESESISSQSQSISQVSVSSQSSEAISSISVESSSTSEQSEQSQSIVNTDQGASAQTSSEQSTNQLSSDSISIDDPYECLPQGKGRITGNVSLNAVEGVVEMVITNQADNTVYSFNPSLDKTTGAYVIDVDHINTNAQNYVKPGSYTAVYSVTLGEQQASGSYTFVATSQCDAITTVPLPRSGAYQMLLISVVILGISSFVVIFAGTHKKSPHYSA